MVQMMWLNCWFVSNLSDRDFVSEINHLPRSQQSQMVISISVIIIDGNNGQKKIIYKK